MMSGHRGITLIELLIVIVIIGILALIGIPEINRFAADSKVKSCATDLLQNMRLARAMAIKENRAYLITFDTAANAYRIGFDGNGDNDLLDAADGFGTCTGAACVRMVNLQQNYGSNIQFGTIAPNGADGLTLCGGGGKVCFGVAENNWVVFNPNGSIQSPNGDFRTPPPGNEVGSVYFQHTGRGFSYQVILRNLSGHIDLFKWDGDKDYPSVTTWAERR